MAITAAWQHRGGTGTTISGRCPFPLVLDAGSTTTSTHTYIASDGGVGIRLDENLWTGVTYTSGSGATRTISKTNLASAFSWNKVSLGTLPAGTSGNWTASVADSGALWHNGTGMLGPPIAVKLNGTVIPVGTQGALSNEQWSYGDSDGIGDNSLYIQSALTTPTVEVVYGDGTHVRLSSVAGSVSIGWFEVEDKIDKNTIKLVADIAPGLTPTDVVVYQNVDPWFDLEYIWEATANTVEPITNMDLRPSAPGGGLIDTHVGYGPTWAFAFVDGCGSSTIDLTVNDLVNGETTTKSLTFTETAWTGSTDYYIAAAGNDTTGDGSIGNPWQTWEKLLNSLQLVSGARRGFLNRGDTFTLAATPNKWSNETDDTLIQPYGTGAAPYVVCGNTLTIWDIGENTGAKSANIRVRDLDIEKTSGGQVMLFWNGNNNLLLNCDITYGGSINANGGISRGSGGAGVDDSVVWDCRYETTNASANYWFYDSGASGSGIRMAYVGNKMFGIGGGATSSNIRTFCQRRMLAYNYIQRSNTTGNPMIRLYGSAVTAKKNYVAYNYLLGTGGTSGITIADDGTGNNGDVLLEGNYIDTSGSTVTGECVQMEDGGGARLLARNNVARGRGKFLNMTQSAQTIRLYHNSFYSALSGTVQFVSRPTGAGCTNLKIVNNAMAAPSSGGSSIIFQNTGLLATIACTHLIENIVDWSSLSSAWSIQSSTGGLTASGWPTQTNKSGQLNYTTTQGKDNDPGYVSAGTGDLFLLGSSICVGTAYPLASVVRDHRGYVVVAGGPREDIGAFEYAGVRVDETAPIEFLIGMVEELDTIPGGMIADSGVNPTNVALIVWDGLNWLWDPSRPLWRSIKY